MYYRIKCNQLFCLKLSCVIITTYRCLVYSSSLCSGYWFVFPWQNNKFSEHFRIMIEPRLSLCFCSIQAIVTPRSVFATFPLLSCSGNELYLKPCCFNVNLRFVVDCFKPMFFVISALLLPHRQAAQLLCNVFFMSCHFLFCSQSVSFHL